MALTKISRGLLDTGVSDSSDATAITIDSSENVLLGVTSLNRLGSGSSAVSFSLGNTGTSATDSAEAYLYNAATASGRVVGAVCFGTSGASASEKRSALISSRLSATSSTNVSGELNFYTTNAGSIDERMRIDSSGNVGINTSSADGKVDIAQDQNTTAASFTTPHLALTATGTTNTTGFTGISYAASTLTNYGWTAGSLRAGTGGSSGSFIFRYHNNSAAGTERMRLSHTGNVQVTTSGADISTFYNGAGSNVGWGGDVSGYFAACRGATNTPLYVSHSSTGSGEFINFLQSTTSRGTISYNGSVMVYGGTSDYRLKENVVDLPNATTRLNALRPVSFDWIETGENSEGFLAHEVQEQVPYAVQGTHNELYTEEGVGEEQADLVGEPKYQQVDYGKLTPLLVKALQESNAKIEALETRIETLENA